VAYPVHLSVGPNEGQNRLWGIPFFGIFVREIVLIPQIILLFFFGIALYVFVFINWIPVLINGRQASWGYSLGEAYFTLSARAGMYLTLVTGKYPPIGWSGDHPVNVSFERGEAQNRLWGIPFFGVLVRWILLIPHFIVIGVLAFVVGLLFLVSWIPVLVNGRQASAIVNFMTGFYRWTLRALAYGLLLTGKYPPFSFGD
jgi:hypothetical protein